MTANHVFGNECYFPSLVVDNVKIVDESGKQVLTEINVVDDYNTDPNAEFPYRGVNDPNVHVAGEMCQDGKINVNPYNPPASLKVINNDANGYTVYIKDYPFWDNTALDGVEVRQP
jgi:hypothetical protein